MENFRLMKAKKFSCIWILIIVISTLWMIECSSSAQLVGIGLYGDKNLNGGGYAVEVYICQLKNETNFVLADTESFWQEGIQDLAADLVGTPIKTMLKPDEVKSFQMEISKEAKYIGAAANFYSPDKNRWRQVFNTSELPKDIWIVVGYNNIEIKELKF
jgi:type VI secretion system VasD/TssJ family lipoprotein